MSELTSWVSDHTKKLISLNVSHITDDQRSYILDASQKALLEQVTTDHNGYKIYFRDPENVQSTTRVTLSAPLNATVTTSQNEMTITYDTQNSKIKLQLTSELEYNQPQVSQQKNDQAYVKEFKGPKDELKKIVIHIPADSIDQSLLEVTKDVLHQILTEWQVISVAKRTAAQLTILHSRVKVEDVALVYLPGDSFFQLSGKDGKESITIDIPLDIFVNVEKKSMSFTFDNIAYELVKIA